MINTKHQQLSVRRQSELLKINRSMLYYEESDKSENFILSCNSIPLSDLELDIEDLGDITLFEKKIIPSKINIIEKLNDDVIKIVVRIPPNSDFNFNSPNFHLSSDWLIIPSFSIPSAEDVFLPSSFVIG